MQRVRIVVAIIAIVSATLGVPLAEAGAGDPRSPERLNGPLVSGGDVRWPSGFLVSDDGTRVVYRADQNTNDVWELFSTPIGGGTASRVNDALPSGGSAFGFEISTLR